MKYTEHQARAASLRRHLALGLACFEVGAYPHAVFYIAYALMEATAFAPEQRVLDVIQDHAKEPEMGRELQTDFSPLDDDAKEHAAWPSFVEAMKGREYGAEALHDAWSWYRKGYVDAQIKRDRETT